MSESNFNYFPEIVRPGVLNNKQINYLMTKNVISNGTPPEDLSSFDLHLSNRGWEITGGIKGDPEKKIEDIINSAKENISLKISDIFLNEKGKRLEKGKTYLFKLKESIKLISPLSAQGTGKSSIGRLDVFTRLLSDYENKYDVVEPCYKESRYYKDLYIEITPLSFSIKVYPDLSIFQLRLFYGDFRKLEIGDDHLELYSDLFINNPDHKQNRYLTLNLNPIKITGNNRRIVAFKAKKNRKTIDLKSNGIIPPNEYWEPIEFDYQIKNKPALHIEKGEFYILRSVERFTLPDDIAIYGLAMTEVIGELRIHHAGFVHPLFGFFRNDRQGAPLIFEVRGHDFDVILCHGDIMAELKHYPLSQKISDDDTKKEQKKQQKMENFSNQELKLSKVFKDWSDES